VTLKDNFAKINRYLQEIGEKRISRKPDGKLFVFPCFMAVMDIDYYPLSQEKSIPRF